MSPARRLRSPAIVLLVFAACGGGGAYAPCDVDDDCGPGFFCRSGTGCDVECRLDVDCVAQGGSCDVARGRCAGGAMDGGSRDGGPACTSDAPCDDGRFCNGVERCVGGVCALGEPPCEAAACDETAGVCDACLDPDRDDDGYDSVVCGGRDCDDDDPRIPRQEVCLPDHVDEDCDPTTVGSLVLDDRDHDGFLPITCCNRTAAGLTCGTDCDDTNTAIFPGATDVCDGIDNDCDGRTDPDCPCIVGDTTMCGYTAPPACTPVTGRCTTAGAFDCPPGLVTGGETETCNGLDDNCNGAVDESVPAIACYTGPPETRRQGICRDGTQACVDGSPRCDGDVTPASETCNGLDDDCNGAVDDGTLPGIGGSCTVPGARGVCASGTTRCEGAPVCRGPSASEELCGDSLDNDCDGFADEEGVCVGPTSCTEGTCGFPGTYAGCSACRRVDCQASVDATYTQDGFTTCSGSFVIGSSRLVWCGETGCFVQYGPYVRLPTGTYEVTLDVHANNGWLHFFDFDVSFPDLGGMFLADLSGGASIPNGAQYNIPGDEARYLERLRFRIDSPCVRVEFRVIYRGATAVFSSCTGTTAPFAVNSRRVVRVGP